MCSLKNAVLKKFSKFTGKTPVSEYFFNKVAELRPATLLKKRPRHNYFPVSFAKFLRTSFLHGKGFSFLQ